MRSRSCSVLSRQMTAGTGGQHAATRSQERKARPAVRTYQRVGEETGPQYEARERDCCRQRQQAAPEEGRDQEHPHGVGEEEDERREEEIDLKGPTPPKSPKVPRLSASTTRR